MLTITTNSFENDVLHADKPVLVDFWAQWCPYCRRIAPAFDKVGEQYSAQSSATRASICASLVWFSAPRSDTSVSHSRSSFMFSRSARISRVAAGAHEPFSMRPIRRFRNPFVCK